MQSPLPNSYWVVPGRLLAGEYPGGTGPEDTRERIALLLDAGIDFFLDLTEPEELEPYDSALPEATTYVRKPVPDHGVPLEPEHMREILWYLADALADGRCVYLHCRAGIGRTGMTVACHLIEQGHAPEAALARLNELWLQCARSATWASVPETPEQITYVRDWRPHRRTTASPVEATAGAPAGAPVPGLRERFRGCLVGLACGDALAVATQGKAPGSFAPAQGFAGGGSFALPRGAWSDDTAMALCLAESLLECGGFDARDQVQRYLRWQQEGHLSATGRCLGITPSVARALAAAQWRRQPFSGSHDPRCLDPEVLARCVPAVLHAFGSAAEAARLAGESARTTCQAPLAIEACRFFGAALHAALSGANKAAVLRPDEGLWRAQLLHPRVAALANGRYRDKGPERILARGNILQALEAVLWAFDRSGDFASGALLAANLGHDSDVVTSAYGALAGAWYGIDAIPAAWRAELVRAALPESFADRFHRLT